jgi:transcription initiation factor TFIIIB Brf1 subunit/transcription initiation factor TFIIB
LKTNRKYKTQKNEFPSQSVLQALETVHGATLDEVCSTVSKKSNFKRETIRERLYYLESMDKVSAITFTLGSVVRKLYCLPRHVAEVTEFVEVVTSDILSFLEERLVVVTPELIEHSRSRLHDPSVGLIQMVLKSLVYKKEIGRRPFLTSRNRIAYFYFLWKNASLVEELLCSLSEYLKRKKYANATIVARDMCIELRVAAYFLRHLSYLGELNVAVVGYVAQYGRCVFIYYIPGYKEIVDERHRIERQAEYMEQAKIMFESLTEQMVLEDKQKVILEASEVLQACIKKGILQGRDLNKLAAGAFIFSLRKLGESASASEIRKHLDALDIGFVSEKGILSTEKIIAQELGIPLHHVPKYRLYIQRFVNSLKIKQEEKKILEQKSLEVFTCLPNRFVMGKKPSTIAAAVIYVAANVVREGLEPPSMFVTQDELSTVSGVTEVSIRNHYRAIEEFYRKYKSEG